jgi:hypothetical protein
MMIHQIVVLGKVIEKNHAEGFEERPIKILPERPVYGLIIRKPSRLIYDPRGQHRAYLTVDCDASDIEEQGIVRQAARRSGIYYVYTDRNAVRAKKEAPCLCMKLDRDHTRDAYRIDFPGDITVAYTTGEPFLGSKHVRLWIESTLKPLPVPEWHDRTYFRQRCG